MKKCFPLTVLGTMLLTLACTAATPRHAQLVQGICTRDINPWGHASQCSCEEGMNYDERSGFCLNDGAGHSVMVQGKVMAGVMAIGGETTGFVITPETGEPYELILQTKDQEKLMKLNGLWFEVEGEMLLIEAVERGERKAIIVERISVLE